MNANMLQQGNIFVEKNILAKVMIVFEYPSKSIKVSLIQPLHSLHYKLEYTYMTIILFANIKNLILLENVHFATFVFNY